MSNWWGFEPTPSAQGRRPAPHNAGRFTPRPDPGVGSPAEVAGLESRRHRGRKAVLFF
jgi:hypothetical protein